MEPQSELVSSSSSTLHPHPHLHHPHNHPHPHPHPPPRPSYNIDTPHEHTPYESSPSHVSLRIKSPTPTRTPTPISAPSPSPSAQHDALFRLAGSGSGSGSRSGSRGARPSRPSCPSSREAEADAVAVSAQLDVTNLLLRAGHMADDVQQETRMLTQPTKHTHTHTHTNTRAHTNSTSNANVNGDGTALHDGSGSSPPQPQPQPQPQPSLNANTTALTGVFANSSPSSSRSTAPAHSHSHSHEPQPQPQPHPPPHPPHTHTHTHPHPPPPPPPPPHHHHHHHHHHHGLKSWFFTYCWRSPKSRMPVGELYIQEYTNSKWKYRYYRYINPWIRFLLIFPILYLYTVSSAELTYRGNVWQAELLNCTRQLTVTHPQLLFPNRKPIILRDLMFDAIPAATGDTLNSWDVFVNFSPAFFSIMMAISFLIRWDIVRITEYIAIQMWMFAWNGLIHVMTSVPDAGNNMDSCLNSKYHSAGDWIFSKITFDYCNDMMWSGHTANTLLPLIMIRRLLWDMVGWSFTAREQRQSTRQSPSPSRADKLADIVGSEAQADPVTDSHFMQQHQLAQQFHHTDSYHGANAFLQYLFEATARMNRRSAAGQVEMQAHEEEEEGGGLHSALPNPQAQPHLQQQLQDVAPGLDPHPHPHSHSAPKDHAHHLNVDQDWFFHVKSSPYVTSGQVLRHRVWYGSFMWFVRVTCPCWFALLCIGIIVTRYHYSMDVAVACLVTLLTTSNTQLLQPMVRWLYRPYYHNYLYREWWKPVYLTYPLNQFGPCSPVFSLCCGD